MSTITQMSDLAEIKSGVPFNQAFTLIQQLDRRKIESREKFVLSLKRLLAAASINLGVSKEQLLAEFMKEHHLLEAGDKDHINILDFLEQVNSVF